MNAATNRAPGQPPRPGPIDYWSGRTADEVVTAARNICAMHKLERLAAGFGEAGIPLMLLKGAALHLALNRPPHARPMGDVDVLVRSADVERALRLLARMGVRRGADLVRADFFPRYHYEAEFLVGEVRSTRLDLHARPFRPLRYARLVPPTAFWDHAQRVPLGRAEVWLPDATDMLIHLATHAAVHDFSDPRWLVDLEDWVAVYGTRIDWGRLEQRAAAWKLTWPVRAALARLAERRPLPPGAREALERYPVSWRDRLALWHAPRDARHPIGHVVVNALSTPGRRFVAGYLAAVALPSRTHMADWYRARHPGWLVWAYVWRVLRGPLRRLGGEWRKMTRGVSRNQTCAVDRPERRPPDRAEGVCV